ncbi:methyl-accepting chemotaxis protein [Idiomarina xiamenensis]|uniref:Methyl-accepting chemotaxis protein n=1 Tax=Idiomarina xiamenensis 10-D-4 TaxID=740709 RepID=K2JZ05_9GAMM|nr:methyl-accepting chemotaxis protein [Idiomarina xiamenensis]EKE80623.1 methyl-accepting chemotaxis protein [Idiomarina xiamenensis 10-D-4]
MFRSVSIGFRAKLAFAFIALLMIGLGLFAVTQQQRMQAQTDEITDVRAQMLEAVYEVAREFLRVRVHTSNIAAATNAADRTRYIARLENADKQFTQALARFDDFNLNANEQRLMRELRTLIQGFNNIQQQVIEKAQAGQNDDAFRLRDSQLMPQTDKVTDIINQLLSLQRDDIKTAATLSADIASTSLSATISAVVISVLLMFLLAWLLTRSIVEPIGRAVGVAKRIAQRDLSLTVDVDGNDEATQLLAALRDMQHGLSDAMRQIGESSDQLASTSEELNSVTEDSSRALHEQTEQLQLAATAVNELTAAIEEVARNAQTTADSSQLADERSQQGLLQIQEMLKEIEGLVADMQRSSSDMTQLANQVKSITSVLDVIRGIADQTNLLALNAAIEAARAGESGRGFAVVADEVRALAKRTQDSTAEIEGMITAVQGASDASVKSMQRGEQRATGTLDMARGAGEALSEITAAVSDINELNLSIASASEEQSKVAREVDGNLTRVNDLSAQTATGANQTAASSAELARLASRLSEMVARFKLANG